MTFDFYVCYCKLCFFYYIYYCISEYLVLWFLLFSPVKLSIAAWLSVIISTVDLKGIVMRAVKMAINSALVDDG